MTALLDKAMVDAELSAMIAWLAAGNLITALELMASASTSIYLTIEDWASPNARWECSWVVGGQRYMGYGRDPRLACQQAIEALRAGLRAL